MLSIRTQVKVIIRSDEIIFNKNLKLSHNLFTTILSYNQILNKKISKKRVLLNKKGPYVTFVLHDFQTLIYMYNEKFSSL